MSGYGEDFAKFYDRFFGDYAEKAAPVLLRFFASKTAASRNLGVLDLGCGTGRLALRFLEAGYEVTGLDLSADMLALAETRCARYRIGGKARFIQGDISGFKLEGPFGLVFSTYNSMNHLDTKEKLSGCFTSVKKCLAQEGTFLFDYHTAKGLWEWVYAESTRWEEGQMEATGTFDETAGKAVMCLKGEFQGRSLDESLSNYTVPLEKIGEWLREVGFARVTFAGMENLEKPLVDPEGQKRIVVIAQL